MDILYTLHDNLVRQVPGNFFRFLFERLPPEMLRMQAIRGPRGTGKTTLMLQYIRFRLPGREKEALYVTADHYWFYTHSLAETADEFYRNGGRFLFIDEVHKYPRWSRELKNIYDAYPDLKVMFSASSALDIYRGEADLSRRVITYTLPGLSFREYLQLAGAGTFPPHSLQEIANRHREIAQEVVGNVHPLPLFREYLRKGYLPAFHRNRPEEVAALLSQVINAIVESDLAYIGNYGPGTAHKVKKLLGVLAESAPFKPNIAAISRKLDVSRDSVYDWLTHLEKARLLNLLMAGNKGVSLLQKPEKVYLENTNLAYALRPNPDAGSIRETFLFSQLVNTETDVRFPITGDFLAEDIYIEVGGKEKSASQVKGRGKYIVAAAETETGFGNKAPLWLFGFMY